MTPFLYAALGTQKKYTVTFRVPYNQKGQVKNARTRIYSLSYYTDCGYHRCHASSTEANQTILLSL